MLTPFLSARLVRGALFTLCALFSVSTATSADGWSVVASAKTKPLGGFVEETSGFARAVRPGMGTEVGLMLLAPLGYPHFEGVSADLGCTVFVLRHSRTEQYAVVGLVQASPESSLANGLSVYSLAGTRVGEWLWVSDWLLPEKIEEPLLEDLFKEASTPATDLLHLRMHPTGLRQAGDDVKVWGMLKLGVPLGFDITPEQLLGLAAFDVLWERLSGFGFWEYRLNTQGRTLELSYRVEAAPGSAESVLFEAGSELDEPVLEVYSEPKDALVGHIRLPESVVDAYVRGLFAQLKKESTAQVHALAQQVEAQWVSLSDGGGLYQGLLEKAEQAKWLGARDVDTGVAFVTYPWGYWHKHNPDFVPQVPPYESFTYKRRSHGQVMEGLIELTFKKHEPNSN